MVDREAGQEVFQRDETISILINCEEYLCQRLMGLPDQKPLAEHVEQGDLKLMKWLKLLHRLKHLTNFKISIGSLLYAFLLSSKPGMT